MPLPPGPRARPRRAAPADPTTSRNLHARAIPPDAGATSPRRPPSAHPDPRAPVHQPRPAPGSPPPPPVDRTPQGSPCPTAPPRPTLAPILRHHPQGRTPAQDSTRNPPAAPPHYHRPDYHRGRAHRQGTGHHAGRSARADPLPPAPTARNRARSASSMARSCRCPSLPACPPCISPYQRLAGPSPPSPRREGSLPQQRGEVLLPNAAPAAPSACAHSAGYPCAAPVRRSRHTRGASAVRPPSGRTRAPSRASGARQREVPRAASRSR